MCQAGGAGTCGSCPNEAYILWDTVEKENGRKSEMINNCGLAVMGTNTRMRRWGKEEEREHTTGLMIVKYVLFLILLMEN